MKNDDLLLKIPLFAFCLFMIFAFYNGFMNPEGTDYWIVKFGLPILFLELISLFTFICLSIMVEFESFRDWPFYLLIVMLIVVLFLSLLFDIWLFVFFLVSITVKFFALKRYFNIKKSNEKFGVLSIVSFSWLFGIFAGFIGSSSLSNSYLEQSNLITEYIIKAQQKGIEFVGTTPENTLGATVFLWGISYFILTIVITLIIMLLNWKEKEK